MTSSNTISLGELDGIWKSLKSFASFEIVNTGEDLEFRFNGQVITPLIKLVSNADLLNNSGDSFFTIKRKNEEKKIRFFHDLISLLQYHKKNEKFTEDYDFFVFNFKGDYLYFNRVSKKIVTNSHAEYVDVLLKKFSDYTKLLEIFKFNIPKLVDLDRPEESENEFVILSKGAENFITTVKYKEIDDSIFLSPYNKVPIIEFKLKLNNLEWVASFKNVLCNYMELQIESQRTFAVLYYNFTYIFNQTEKNYSLFVSRFSFDKIRNQFYSEKKAYFDGLGTAQDKISAQIISIPISLGASIFSFYQLSTSYNVIILIYLSIFLYSLFIVGVISSYLKDVNKLVKDVNKEYGKLKQHFSEILKDFEDDFQFMKSKRRFIRFLGYSIIIALALTFIATTYFIFSYKQVSSGSIFKLL